MSFGVGSAHNNAIEMRGPMGPSSSKSCFGIPWVHERFQGRLKYMRSPELSHGFFQCPVHSSQHFLRLDARPVLTCRCTRLLEPTEKHAVATFSLKLQVQSLPAFSRCAIE